MPYKAFKPMFTLFKGYIDDSGNNDEIFTLSCIIAKPTNWGFFINDWLEVLRRKNEELAAQGRKTISRFHAVDCSNYAEEFEGWNEPERREFMAQLVKVFQKTPNATNAIGYSVRLKTLVEEIPDTAPNPRGFAYALCYANY